MSDAGGRAPAREGGAVVTVTPNPALDWTLTIPGFAAGAVNRVTAQRTRAGGKGVNVAARLAAHGHRVAATGFLGRDNAAPFEALLADLGIEDRFVRVDGATRVGIKIVDPDGGGTTDVNFPGLAPDDTELLALDDTLAALGATGVRWAVLAGSLPPGVPPTFHADAARVLRAAGCRVAVDTSGDALRHAVEAGPHVVKPNVHELESLVGEPLPTRAAVLGAARELLRRGVELAVVSMGAEGALFVRDGEAVLAVPPRVAVGSTVGAGDAMVAGTVSGLLRGLSLGETARLATAFSVAAIALGSDGERDPVAWVADVRGRVLVEDAVAGAWGG